MIAVVRDRVVGRGLIDAGRFDEGLKGLERSAERDGVFCYTFFKGTACA